MYCTGTHVCGCACMWKSPGIYVGFGHLNSSTKRRVTSGIIFICSAAFFKEAGFLYGNQSLVIWLVLLASLLWGSLYPRSQNGIAGEPPYHSGTYRCSRESELQYSCLYTTHKPSLQPTPSLLFSLPYFSLTIVTKSFLLLKDACFL